MRVRELMTERRNPATENMDTMSALELVTAMNREDAIVPRAIHRVLPQIARAVDRIAQQLAKGGRLIYVGSGTSGRIGALDASECSPTFGVDAETVQFMIAGGERALVIASEASEDSTDSGRTDIAARKPGKRDVVVGIAASGSTPYTVSAVQYARSRGAATIGIACNRNSELGRTAEIAIEVEVGPEVLTGSSRLKAGSAEKMVCNMLTTGALTRLGYVYSNLMVNMHLKNNKVLQRGITILELLTDADREIATKTLEKAGMSASLALVMLKKGVSKAEAARRLRKAKGNVRKAIED
ncbi:MAG TPA: N-acetylmuramic acid 6-phosphate etherase [Terracidiphilus sp.]|nr:N-acetylmuramic acid 6-phosphate etherase [Terracidiphilus sp.]